MDIESIIKESRLKRYYDFKHSIAFILEYLGVEYTYWYYVLSHDLLFKENYTDKFPNKDKGAIKNIVIKLEKKLIDEFINRDDIRPIVIRKMLKG